VLCGIGVHSTGGAGRVYRGRFKHRPRREAGVRVFIAPGQVDLRVLTPRD